MQDLADHLFHSITASQWRETGIATHHGIAFPLSAIHSKNSCGVGEFYDLCPLIDWCQTLKMDVIQLLPLNNGEQDPSPYNAISSCALNFLYLSLHALPFLEQLPDLKKQLKDLTDLTKSPRICFEDVYTHKLSWLHAYFCAIGEKVIQSQALESFLKENNWVEPYALFRAIKDHLGNTPWSSWPSELKLVEKKEYPVLLERYWSKVSLHIFLQYLCYSQFKAIKAYAKARQVKLMGDIPILVSGESSDVWEHPELFDTSSGAGAPPDTYNKEGQAWGFPLYRWDVFRKTNFTWWKRRLQYAANFYDIFRIDHVIGFFRIWSVPLTKPASEGSFVPEDETLWEMHGRELLKMLISSSPMLPIAEDLGTVPPVVRPVLQEMGICSTKVMRWERKWEEDKQFIPLQDYPPISLTCISTHDSDTLQQWWKNYPEESQVFALFKQWPYVPDLTLPQRKEILWDSHHTSSLFHINLLQEYLALFPELVGQDPDGERINIPGKVLDTNWTYRFRPSVEEITSHEGLLKSMQEILVSG